MPSDNTLIAVSAFSGLAGALLSQALTGLFAYFSDKRKSKTEAKNQYRSKQIEVAENFYFMTGETMAILKKSINYWKNRNDSHSGASLDFLNKEIKGLNMHLEKLNAENWKHNLVGLYFNVALSYSEINEANTRSHLLYLKTLDIADSIVMLTGKIKRNYTASITKAYLIYVTSMSVFMACSQWTWIR